jgi:hypothetical protein
LLALVSRRDVLMCSRMCREVRFGMLDRRKHEKLAGAQGPRDHVYSEAHFPWHHRHERF